MLDEKRDVFESLAQRGNANGKDIQTIEQIASKLAVINHSRQVTATNSFTFIFLFWMQAKFFELLAHLQSCDAEPLRGFRQVAVCAPDCLRVEFRFKVSQH